LNSKVADLVRPHAEQHRLTVDAALGNDIDKVIKAMQHDPMNKWIEDPERIEYLTRMMLYYEQQWLPEKWQEWIPKREELEKSRFWIAPKELQKFGRKHRQKKHLLTENLRSKAYFDN
jgi:hypothetical protein